MAISKRTKLGMWLFTICAATFLLLETRGAFKHWEELSDTWPPHSMFHAVSGLFYAQAMCIMVIVLTWIPLKQGQPWSWWGVALLGIAIHGGHVVADFMTNGGLSHEQAAGGSGSMFFKGTVTALILYVIGLILTRPHVNRGGEHG